MAPSGRRKRRRTTPKACAVIKPRDQCKKCLKKCVDLEGGEEVASKPSENISPEVIDSIDFKNAGDDEHNNISPAGSGCCTPKARRFRIPEIKTCPPAPKKRRVISNCSLKRNPITFFANPDLEHFFFFALRNVSV